MYMLLRHEKVNVMVMNITQRSVDLTEPTLIRIFHLMDSIVSMVLTNFAKSNGVHPSIRAVIFEKNQRPDSRSRYQ